VKESHVCFFFHDSLFGFPKSNLEGRYLETMRVRGVLAVVRRVRTFPVLLHGGDFPEVRFKVPQRRDGGGGGKLGQHEERGRGKSPSRFSLFPCCANTVPKCVVRQLSPAVARRPCPSAF
jgi:hypothetical protein